MSGAPVDRRAPRFRLLEKLPARVPYLRSARAFQPALQREVELRILRGGTPEALTALFFDELRDLASLDHRAFLPVLSDLALEGRPCYTVPMRSHPTLAELVQADEETFSMEARGRAVRSLAGALSALHLRDVKLGPVRPELICWDAVDESAYFLHHKAVDEDWTRGLLRHTPLEERPEDYGKRDDVFYWGLLSFWVLSRGQHAYGAGPESLRPLRGVVTEVSPNLALVVEAALAWDPGGRPEGGPELLSVLQMDAANVATPDLGVDESRVDMRKVSDEVQRKVEFLRTSGRIPLGPRNEPREADSGEDARLRTDDSLVGLSMDLPRLAAEAKKRGLAAPDAGPQPRGLAPKLGFTLLLLLGVGLGYYLATGPGEVEAPPERPTREATRKAENTGPRLGTGRKAERTGHADVEVSELLSYRQDILPEDFEVIWKKLQSLVVAKKLPSGLNDGKKLMRLYVRFKRSPRRACKELQAWIGKVRERVGDEG